MFSETTEYFSTIRYCTWQQIRELDESGNTQIKVRLLILTVLRDIEPTETNLKCKIKAING